MRSAFLPHRFGFATSPRLRLNLPLSVLAAAIAVPSGEALAQDEAPPQERIVVTGTRIEQPDFVFSNPVVSVTAEDMQSSGDINTTTFLTELPATRIASSGGR